MNYNKHSSAIVDKGAQIGEGTKIWHFSHICAGAIIGKNVSIGQNVYVSNNAIIGNNCKIQNNISIYDNVILEDDVFCGPSMVFTNVYNPRAQISRKDEYKQIIVKRGVTISANAIIICGITLGSFSFIAAGSVARKNVKPYALIAGVPGQQIGWMSEFGERIPLPLKGSGKFICPNTQKKYELNDTELILID